MDATNNFRYGTTGYRGLIALAEIARRSEDDQEWWNDNPMHACFDALLAGAKALVAAADHLVAEVEAYDAKHPKGGK